MLNFIVSTTLIASFIISSYYFAILNLNITLSLVQILNISPLIIMVAISIITALVIQSIYYRKIDWQTKMTDLFKVLLLSILISIIFALTFNFMIINVIAELQEIFISISSTKMLLISFITCLIPTTTLNLINYAANNYILKEQKTLNWLNLLITTAYSSALILQLFFTIDAYFPSLLASIFAFIPLTAQMTMLLIGVTTGILIYALRYSYAENIINSQHCKLFAKLILFNLAFIVIMILISNPAINLIAQHGWLFILQTNPWPIFSKEIIVGIITGTFTGIMTEILFQPPLDYSEIPNQIIATPPKRDDTSTEDHQTTFKSSSYSI